MAKAGEKTVRRGSSVSESPGTSARGRGGEQVWLEQERRVVPV